MVIQKHTNNIIASFSIYPNMKPNKNMFSVNKGLNSNISNTEAISSNTHNSTIKNLTPSYQP